MTDLALPYLDSDPDVAAFTGQLHGLSIRAADMVSRARSAATGDALDATLVDAIVAGQSAGRAADGTVLVASAAAAARRAYARWRADAPPMSEIEAAQREVDSAVAYLEALPADSPNSTVIAAAERLHAADQNLRDLRRRRRAAGEALAEELRRAAERLRTQRGSGDLDGGRPHVPGAPGTPSAPAPSGPRPVPAPPRTPPAAVTPPPAAPAGSSPDSQAALDNLISQIQRSSPVQAPQQPQAPQPQAAPLSSAPVSQARRDGVIGSRDVDRLVDDKAGDAPTVGFGLASTTPTTTPSPAPTTPPSAPPPATNPGTSREGLNTSTPTNGRSTPEAGAFDSPQTRTSSAGPTATAAETGTCTRPGTGVGHGAPIVPPMGGIGGGGGGMSPRADRDAPRTYNPEEQQAGEGPDIVRGGTIAQNRPDSAA